MMAAMAKNLSDKEKQTPAAINKKAYHDFEFVEKYEAGIELRGSEVKSLRAAPADLTGSYAKMLENECWLVGAKIAPYQQAGNMNHDPSRKRKLSAAQGRAAPDLDQARAAGLHAGARAAVLQQQGMAKVELALAHGKRQYDKRKSITERAQKRDIDRSMKHYRGR